ncbi:MAG: serine hydrolase FSH [Piptocephalis tieghemiana]|nr:MAG: serine hydrolase FSH [Piptocephalis tieghemiana]
MSSSGLFRVLCLPGYTQNGLILRKKTGALRKTLKSVAELEFVDPPFLMSIPKEGPEELRKKIAEQLITEDEKPYAWFFRQEDGSCKGLEEAMDHLFALLDQKGPYDGIFGFSQGAAMAALATIALSKEIGDPLRRGCRHPPTKFAILSSGFRFEDALTLPYYESSSSPCPTLHILGREDTLIAPARTHALASLFHQAEIYEHKGGHVMPSDSAGRKTVLAFLQDIPRGEEDPEEE